MKGEKRKWQANIHCTTETHKTPSFCRIIMIQSNKDVNFFKEIAPIFLYDITVIGIVNSELK